ncbi:hypothetical protein [Stieleria varia]|uniref:Uncharacterized protein n=1 Tax=Stieleria varia TaxID=2528005 RepID=A0A5C6AN11_9BACT|nr:hypothetical protein [Stieleria varia]TWU00801.1 hypothetical protein Pla52n_41700 [Stieleria varia]
MNTPNVSRLSVTDNDGKPASLTISTDIVDYVESARTFGREDLSDPNADGRFQRRMVAIPDKQGDVVTPMVLTISSSAGLYLVRKDGTSGDGDGWRLIDVDDSIEAMVGYKPRIRTFNAAWTDEDQVAIVVAFDDQTSERSRVFVAYNLSTRNTDWQNIAWQDLGTREDVRVEGIRVLSDGKGGWRVVLAGDRGPNDMLYLLDSQDAKPFAKSTVFNPAVTLDEIFDFDAAMHPTQGPGIAVLGTNGGTRDLSFRPFPTPEIPIPPVVPLPCPSGATVIESGLTRPVGRSGRLHATNLYISGEGTYLIEAAELRNQEEAAVTEIVSPSVAAQTQDLVVAENSDGSAVVWTVGQGGRLVMVRKSGEQNAPWSTPLSLRNDVVAIAPVHGDDHTTTSLLTVYRDGHAAFLSREQGPSGQWQERRLSVATPEDAIRITCYGTSFRLLDSSGIPIPEKSVSVSASTLSSVVVNGKSAFIGPNLTVTATTDLNGSINVYDRVSSLTPAVYRFQSETLSEAIDVNPSGGVQERLRSMTGDELRGATITNPDGRSESLLPAEYKAGGQLSAQVDAVAQAMQQVAKLSVTTTGQKLPAGVTKAATTASYSSQLNTASIPDGFRMGIQTTAQGVITMENDVINGLINAGEAVGSFFADIGESIADFFEGIGAKIKEGLQFVMAKVEKGLEFICKIGNQVKRFLVDTLEQLGGMLTWLWDQVKTGLEKVWEYLKFVFDWQDIIIARNVMVTATGEAITYVEGCVDELKDKTEDGFNKVIADIRRWQAEIGVPSVKLNPDEAGGGFGKQLMDGLSSVGDVIDKITGNSVIGWVMEKATGLMDEIITIESENPSALAMKTAKDFVGGLISDEINNVMSLWQQLAADIVSIVGREVPSRESISFEMIQNLIIAVGADLVVGFLESVKDLVVRTLELIRGLIEVVRSAVFAKIRFPFIEKIIKLFSPESDVDVSFRLVDAFMLMLAVPSTIAYKLIFNEAPFKKGQTLNLPLGRATVSSYAIGDIMPYMAIAGGFAKLAVAGYQTKQAVAKKDGLGKMGIIGGLFFGGIGLAAEVFARHDPDKEHNGDTINALEMCGIGAASFVLLTSAAFAAAKWGATADSAEIDAAVSIVGNVALVGVGCAVFGILIDYLRQSEDEYQQRRQASESLRWLTRTFDQAGTILIMSGVFPKDPVLKTILIGSGAACKAGTLLFTISQVVTQKTYVDKALA